jgi:TRAP-type C4-dicarboxylate transport system permease small subunit
VRRFLVLFGDRVSHIGLAIAAICLIAVVAINGANVVARYVFRTPFSWAEEAMLYIMIAGVFWGAIAVAWRQADICIDAFVMRASGRAQRILRSAATLISVGILIWLLIVGLRVTLLQFNYGQHSNALNLPMWIPHSAMVSGILLIILMTVARLLAPARAGTQAHGETPEQGG